MKFSLQSVVCAALAALAAAMPVRGDDINLYLFAGQSNAVGFNADPALLPSDAIDASIRFAFDTGRSGNYANGLDSNSGGIWTTLGIQPWGLANGTNGGLNWDESRYVAGTTQPTDPGGFGPEISLARDLVNDYAVSNVAILKYAYTGTGFAGGQWAKGQVLYDGMLDRYNTAKAQLEAEGHTVHLAGLFWLQGENDSQTGASAAYNSELTQFIADVRSDYGAVNLPVFLGVNTQFNGPEIAQVVAAQQAVAAADANVHYVSTAGATVANTAHFDTAGVLDVGSRYAYVYNNAANSGQSLSQVAAVYRFDGDYTDSSIHGNDGSLVGSGVTIPAGVDGVFGVGKASFASGHTGYVSIPTQSFASTDAWSLSFWLRNTTDAGGLFAGEQGTNDNFLWSDRTGNKFRFDNASGTATDFTGLTAADDGLFHHYALVASGTGDLTLYIDDTQFGATKTGVNTSFVLNVLGAGFNTNGFAFTGQLDDFWIINQALTADQISTLKTSNTFAVTVPTPAVLPAGLGLLAFAAIRRRSARLTASRRV